ncbi:hypothetical protein RvY_09648 [Ramazzottius varieornatus]|uniref:Fe2OG dioxygenase domain-containing protein n=1 Tax=Ramazzottius varieornatus TaxID=947166 RepID=A0A1D1VA37_RAMVA|nr:hypothetical protein RvY_09648 [Ramazzottius varieornatus]
MVKELTRLNQLSGSSRHRQRKGLQRLQHHLQTSALAEISSLPTKTVAIGNAGLACGLSLKDITSVLEKIETVEDLIHDADHKPSYVVRLVPDKPFVLVEHCCEKSAKYAVQCLTGFVFQLNNGTQLPWYPAFVSCSSPTTVINPPTATRMPPDLVLLPDVITEAEEDRWTQFADDILANMTEGPERSTGKPASTVLKNRTTFHYGYHFQYGTNDVDLQKPIQPIPDMFSNVLQRFIKDDHLSVVPDQLTVNVYDPGQGIPLHVDTHSVFEDEICAVSLGSSVIMDFVSSSKHLPVVLPPRSAMIMSGESRYAWKHGIAPRTTDNLPDGETSWRRSRRISFTFRKVRNGPCRCMYTEYCDSQKGQVSKTEVNATLPNGPSTNTEICSPDVEEKFVHEVYEQIAPHFSETRHKAWPKIASFVSDLLPGSVLLDIGCGNGKYLGSSGGKLIEIGCDRSSNLVGICRERGFEVLVADILSLPYRNSCCDAVLCIAVIHHMSSEERRVQALSEIARVLADGGLALLYVWSIEQNRDQKKSSYLKSKKELKEPSGESSSLIGDATCSLPVHVNRTAFQSPDVLVPWHLKSKQEVASSSCKDGDKVFHRYYHVFREGELRQCCNRVSGVQVIEEYYDEGNWCVVLRKV